MEYAEPISELSELAKDPETRRWSTSEIVEELANDKCKKKRLNDELWLYSRVPGFEEAIRDKYHHEIYYCNWNNCIFHTPNAQCFCEHL